MGRGESEPDLESRVIAIAGEVLELPERERTRWIEERSGAGPAALWRRVREVVEAGQSRPGFMATPALRVDVPGAEDGRGLATGTMIGAYRVESLIGVGSMGDVYEARGPGGAEAVALKIVRPGVVTRELRRRFEFEVATLSRLHHGGIARLIDSGTHRGEDGERPFLVMSLVRGGPITGFARSRGLSTDERLGLMLKVCDAVDHAHRGGVIHRDLKPANIIVEESTGEPKVLDFGVARAVDPVGTLSSRPGERLVGSLPYMSPEQACGASVDTRADVYALGAVLFELVCGRPPVDPAGADLASMLESARRGEAPRARQIAAGVSNDLDLVIATALARDPDRRYQSAAALRDDLRRVLGGEPITARDPGTWYLVSTLARRHRAALALGGLVLLLLGSVAAAAVGQHLRASAAEARSELLVAELVTGSRTMIVELNRRLANEGQSLEARRAACESALEYMAGVRQRAGDDPRVVEELANIHAELGAVLGSAGAGSLGQADQAVELFTRSVALYRSVLAVRDSPSLRRNLAMTLEQLSILGGQDRAGAADLLREAVAHLGACASGTAPGPELDSVRASARVLGARIAELTGDLEALEAVIAQTRAAVDADPSRHELWSELGLLQRRLAENLSDERERCRPVALAAGESFRRAIALGGDNASNHQNLSLIELLVVGNSVGEMPAEQAFAQAVEAVRRSRAQAVRADASNFERYKHLTSVLSLASRGLSLARAAPPPGQLWTPTQTAARFAGATREELRLMHDLPTRGAPHPHEGGLLRLVDGKLRELEAMSRDRTETEPAKLRGDE